MADRLQEIKGQPEPAENPFRRFSPWAALEDIVKAVDEDDGALLFPNDPVIQHARNLLDDFRASGNDI